MGFSFKPFKAITRAVGIPDTVAKAVFPVAAIAEAASSALISKAQNFIQPSAKQAVLHGEQGPFAPGPTTIYYQGGYGPPPAYSIYFADDSVYGGPKWDFSMDSSATFWETSHRISPPTSWGDYLLLGG